MHISSLQLHHVRRYVLHLIFYLCVCRRRGFPHCLPARDQNMCVCEWVGAITRKIDKQVIAQPILAHRPGSAQPIAKPKKKAEQKREREAVRRSKRSRQCRSEWTNTNHVFFLLDSCNGFNIIIKRIQHWKKTNSTRWKNQFRKMLKQYSTNVKQIY